MLMCQTAQVPPFKLDRPATSGGSLTPGVCFKGPAKGQESSPRAEAFPARPRLVVRLLAEGFADCRVDCACKLVLLAENQFSCHRDPEFYKITDHTRSAAGN